MNEIQLLRAQLWAERHHVRQVAAACAAAPATAEPGLASLHDAATAYLARVLGWFDAREERLAALGVPRPPGDAPGRGALRRLHAGGAAGADWVALAQFIAGPWNERWAALEALCAANPRAADWRAFSGISADSVYEERALYERVRGALPAGLELA